MSEYFSETKSSGRRVRDELDLSNYATKLDLKNATGIHQCDRYSSQVYMDKLKNVPTN